MRTKTGGIVAALLLALALLAGCSTICAIPGVSALPGCPVATPTATP